MKFLIEIGEKTFTLERKRPDYDSDTLLMEDLEDIVDVLGLALKGQGFSLISIANIIKDREAGE